MRTFLLVLACVAGPPGPDPSGVLASACPREPVEALVSAASLRACDRAARALAAFRSDDSGASWSGWCDEREPGDPEPPVTMGRERK